MEKLKRDVNNKKSKTAILLLFLLIIAGLNTYLLSKYRIGELEVEKITFVSETNKNLFLLYTRPVDAFDINFKEPGFAEAKDNLLTFRPGKGKIRNFRLYVGEKLDTLTAGDLVLFYRNHSEKIGISELKQVNVRSINNQKKGLHLYSAETNGYFELKHDRITFNELVLTEALILSLSVLLTLFFSGLLRTRLSLPLKSFNIKITGVSLFIASVFLPHPVFNVTFILSFALIVSDFKFKTFAANKGGLLFIAYFLVFLINALFVSEQYNSKLMETLLPLALLPIYFAAAPKANYFGVFVTSAVFLSCYLICTSFIDTTIYRNISYFSFDAFSKFVHPVYLSYLLFFSIVCLELSQNLSFTKKRYMPLLFFALLCCGSKLIITLTILFYTLLFIKKQIYLGLTFIAITITSILLFSPTRNRFRDILNVDSLGVLKENPVKTTHDPRLNGLTLRIIIWQESLKALSGTDSFIFGAGVDKAADKLLQDRLTERGLAIGHTKYDPHNQFITTFYKTGIIGLFILLFICAYYYYVALREKSLLLLYVVLLFSIAMFTESVLQRVTGIYFFTIILLLLHPGSITKSLYDLEDSDTGYPGNSQ